ncbi:MAG: hypothetical protein H0W88_12295 [Parachlamydiaceae bacterium]|nr:hypothetical protein [Parachlamydiaceae bacterium]
MFWNVQPRVDLDGYAMGGHSPRAGRNSTFRDTIIAVMISVSSIFGAAAVEDSNPSLASILRVVPLFAAGFWLLRRVDFSGSSGGSYPPAQQVPLNRNRYTFNPYSWFNTPWRTPAPQYRNYSNARTHYELPDNRDHNPPAYVPRQRGYEEPYVTNRQRHVQSPVRNMYELPDERRSAHQAPPAYVPPHSQAPTYHVPRTQYASGTQNHSQTPVRNMRELPDTRRTHQAPPAYVPPRNSGGNAPVSRVPYQTTRTNGNGNSGQHMFELADHR